MNELNKTTLKIMVDESPNAQIIIDNHGKIRYLNHITEKLFKYSDDEIIGKNISILIHFDQQPKHKKNVDSYFTGPLSKMMAEEINPQGLKKDETLFPIEISINPILVDGEIFV